MTKNKPIIALRKENETAFVNARTYWSLSLSISPDELIELRVRHSAEDSFSFVSCAAAERDDVQLYTPSEFEELVDAYLMNEAEERFSRADAVTEMNARGHFVATIAQAAACELLKRHWDAFALLFNPAFNL